MKKEIMLNLLFAESALETVPQSIWGHPSVVKRAKALGKKPRETLLDRTYHHRAMEYIHNSEKRGRPDILHFALLEALGAPLNKEELLSIYVHTIDDHIITIDTKVRLPKNCNRFTGLMEQLYKTDRVPIKGRCLLKLSKGSLEDVFSKIRPSYVMAFTRRGKSKNLEYAMKILLEQKRPMVIIGAFPHGNFSEETVKLADLAVSIDPEMLEACTITSRIIYEFEKLIKLPERRWKKQIGVNQG